MWRQTGLDCDASSEDSGELGAIPVALNRFRIAARCVAVILRFRNVATKHRLANTLHKSSRLLDEFATLEEQRFQSEALNSTALMHKAFQLMSDADGAELGNATLDLVANSAHQAKIYTLRYCWRYHLHPMKQESWKTKHEYDSLRANFSEARLAYLKELSALRDHARGRVDPTTGLPSLDPTTFWAPEQMATPEEIKFLNACVQEMVKSIFDSNPNITQSAALTQLTRLQDRVQSEELQSLKREVRNYKQQIQEMSEKMELERTTHAAQKMRGAARRMSVPSTAISSEVAQQQAEERLCCKEARAGVMLQLQKCQRQLNTAEVNLDMEKMQCRRNEKELQDVRNLASQLEHENTKLNEELRLTTEQLKLKTERLEKIDTEYGCMKDTLNQKHKQLQQFQDQDAQSQLELAELRLRLDEQHEFQQMLQAPSPKETGSSWATHTGSDLCRAASLRDVSHLRQVIARHRVDVNTFDYDSRTALHVAASEGCREIAECLVDEFGASVNPLDRWGSTPYDDAVSSGDQCMIDFLASRGGQSRRVKCVSSAQVQTLETQREQLKKDKADLEQILDLAVCERLERAADDADDMAEYESILRGTLHEADDHAEQSAPAVLSGQLEAVIDRLADAELQLQTLESCGEGDMAQWQKQDELRQLCTRLRQEQRCFEAKLLVEKSEETRQNSQACEEIANNPDSTGSSRMCDVCHNCKALKQELEASQALLAKVRELNAQLSQKLQDASQDSLCQSTLLSAYRDSMTEAERCLSASKTFRNSQDDSELHRCAEIIQKTKNESNSVFMRLYQGGNVQSRARRETRRRTLIAEMRNALQLTLRLSTEPSGSLPTQPSGRSPLQTESEATSPPLQTQSEVRADDEVAGKLKKNKDKFLSEPPPSSTGSGFRRKSIGRLLVPESDRSPAFSGGGGGMVILGAGQRRIPAPPPPSGNPYSTSGSFSPKLTASDAGSGSRQNSPRIDESIPEVQHSLSFSARRISSQSSPRQPRDLADAQRSMSLSARRHVFGEQLSIDVPRPSISFTTGSNREGRPQHLPSLASPVLTQKWS
eukprot:TRINITY_DN106087_c0_g1_i1.p1 TRINITY_DN106087_c0_g1~~TRINITY_DN106087_c0_g1_i1.p1  ORF type:complete len:1056 (+),score=200.47 TRINITY_DN106087_c0_g1_i1:102-3269(+)